MTSMAPIGTITSHGNRTDDINQNDQIIPTPQKRRRWNMTNTSNVTIAGLSQIPPRININSNDNSNVISNSLLTSQFLPQPLASHNHNHNRNMNLDTDINIQTNAHSDDADDQTPQLLQSDQESDVRHILANSQPKTNKATNESSSDNSIGSNFSAGQALQSQPISLITDSDKQSENDSKINSDRQRQPNTAAIGQIVEEEDEDDDSIPTSDYSVDHFFDVSSSNSDELIALMSKTQMKNVNTKSRKKRRLRKRPNHELHFNQMLIIIIVITMLMPMLLQMLMNKVMIVKNVLMK